MISVQINVTNKKEEPLLSRRMITAVLEFEKATPSYQEVGSLLATNLKTDEKLIAIRHIYNLFGDKKAEVIAYVYSDESKKQFIEPKIKEKKGKKKEEKINYENFLILKELKNFPDVKHQQKNFNFEKIEIFLNSKWLRNKQRKS